MRVTKMSLDVLHSDIQDALSEISQKTTVLLANTVTYSGTRYTVGMILFYGSTGGLPDFAEIIQVAILDNCVHFRVELLVAWYEEHLRSFQLEDTGKIALLEQQKFDDGCVQCWRKMLGYTQTSCLLFILGN